MDYLSLKNQTSIVQQAWDKTVAVRAFDSKDQARPFRFKYIDIIGNGTFGIVCRAQDLDSKEIVAIKTVYQDEGHQV